MSSVDLSNRKTTSNRVPEIDSLYVYATSHKISFTHRHQRGAGYRYTTSKIILRAGVDEIHIYHRTATIRGVTKGLTMVTKDPQSDKVLQFFREQIREIERSDELFDKFRRATPSPSELGIRYFY